MNLATYFVTVTAAKVYLEGTPPLLKWSFMNTQCLWLWLRNDETKTQSETKRGIQTTYVRESLNCSFPTHTNIFPVSNDDKRQEEKELTELPLNEQMIPNKTMTFILLLHLLLVLCFTQLVTVGHDCIRQGVKLGIWCHYWQGSVYSMIKLKHLGQSDSGFQGGSCRASAVISIRESCLFLTQCHPRDLF